MGGEAMTSAGGNFRRVLRIDAGKVWLRGPFELEKDQTLSKMYIWLWQSNGDGTGAAATAVVEGRDFHSPAARREGGAEWRTTAQLAHGRFRAGPATGMALAILERNGRTTPYWWSDSNIALAPPSTATASLVSSSADVNTLLTEALRRALIGILGKR